MRARSQRLTASGTGCVLGAEGAAYGLTPHPPVIWVLILCKFPSRFFQDALPPAQGANTLLSKFTDIFPSPPPLHSLSFPPFPSLGPSLPPWLAFPAFCPLPTKECVRTPPQAGKSQLPLQVRSSKVQVCLELEVICSLDLHLIGSL